MKVRSRIHFGATFRLFFLCVVIFCLERLRFVVSPWQRLMYPKELKFQYAMTVTLSRQHLRWTWDGDEMLCWIKNIPTSFSHLTANTSPHLSGTEKLCAIRWVNAPYGAIRFRNHQCCINILYYFFFTFFSPSLFKHRFFLITMVFYRFQGREKTRNVWRRRNSLATLCHPLNLQNAKNDIYYKDIALFHYTPTRLH